jgi:cytochrome c556
MSKLLSSSLLALAAAFALTACNEEPKDTHPDQPVSKRRAVFKQFTRTLEPMGLVARNRKDYNPREFNISALELEKLSKQPWAHFTPDSNYPPTHAKAEVWQKPADFKEAQDQYLATVSQLVKAAQGGDLELIRPAVNDVQKSCKACHTQFRNDAAT